MKKRLREKKRSVSLLTSHSSCVIKSNRKSKIFFSLGGSRTRIFSSQSVVRSQKSMRCGSTSNERTTQRREEALLRAFVFVHSLGETSSAHRRSDLSRASSQTSIRFWRIRYGRKFASSSKARALWEEHADDEIGSIKKKERTSSREYAPEPWWPWGRRRTRFVE